MSKTQAERITALETQVENLAREVSEMNQKLSDLVALKHKGAGAFWLGSVLFGTSLVGVFSMLVDFFRGG